MPIQFCDSCDTYVDLDEDVNHLKECVDQSNPNYRHGMSRTRQYTMWAGMLNRCTHESQLGFKYYGGKGIRVCKKWLSFQGFWEDMGSSYLRHIKKHGAKNTTLDRKNNSRGYNKSNCRWATRFIQSRNQSRNRLVTIGGVTKILTDWITDANMDRSTFYIRVNKKGMSVEEAITKKLDAKKSMAGKTQKHFEEHDDGSDDTGREQEDREQELWGVDANEHELSSIESSMGF